MERFGSRLTTIAGLVFVLLSIVGIALITKEPALSDSPRLLVSYLHTHRHRVLTTNALLSLANGALIVFVVSLRRTLPAACGDLCLIAVTLLCAIGATTAAIPAALAHYGTAGLTAAQVHTLVSIYFAANAFSALPAALLLGAVAVAAARDLARSALAIVSGVFATVQLLMTFSLLGSGAFSPDSHSVTGAIFGPLTLWVAFVSITAARGRASRPTGAAPRQPVDGRLRIGESAA